MFQIVDDEISQLVENQNRLEGRYEQMVSQKAGMRAGGPGAGGYALSERRAEAHRDAQTLAGELRNATHVFGRGLKQSPLTSDNLEKVQQDRCEYCRKLLRPFRFRKIDKCEENPSFEIIHE